MRDEAIATDLRPRRREMHFVKVDRGAIRRLPEVVEGDVLDLDPTSSGAGQEALGEVGLLVPASIVASANRRRGSRTTRRAMTGPSRGIRL